MSKFLKRLLKLLSFSQTESGVHQEANIDGHGNVITQIGTQIVKKGSADFVVEPGKLDEFTRAQLNYEINSGKYIPNVFIETHEIKEFARVFAHPILFLQRTFDSLERFDISNCNEYLEKAGMPPLPFPNIENLGIPVNFGSLKDTTGQLIKSLDASIAVAQKYAKEGYSKNPPFPVAHGKEHIYEERKHNLYFFGSGVGMKLEKRRSELAAAQSGLFILTGKAGQGKTNFVCDFVDTFLLSHSIPCAYFSGRKVGVRNANDLGDSIQQAIFDGAAGTYENLLAGLSGYCETIGKPFVLIIDGINEHPNVHDFSIQIEDLIERSFRVPNVKILLTCRSEFFSQRFGNLNTAAFSDQIFFHESDNWRLGDRHYALMVEAYFQHFELRTDLIPPYVINNLEKDILLLRFFCEAYGARDKPDGYEQPEIRDIYRDEIFRIYLDQKMTAASARLDASTRASGLGASRRDLESVLKHVLEFMIAEWEFGSVPISRVPRELYPALSALLDEDMILRVDAPNGVRTFKAHEEVINFTFDEFRDFMLANYLHDEVFTKDRKAFEAVLSRAKPENTQSIEGLKRFLFYISRSSRDESFLEFYQAHSWYRDVYLREIFNINGDLLRDEDQEITLKRIEVGGYEELRAVKRIAVRWNSERNPVLNLELLLRYLETVDDDVYDRLVVSNFADRSWERDGAGAAEFCGFMQDEIIPGLVPSSDGEEVPLVRFLVLLLPVDADRLLESKGMQIFRLILKEHVDYGVEVLLESFSFRFTRHRAYVWRLLSSVRDNIGSSHPLYALARKDAEMDNVSGREARRFLGQENLKRV